MNPKQAEKSEILMYTSTSIMFYFTKIPTKAFQTWPYECTCIKKYLVTTSDQDEAAMFYKYNIIHNNEIKEIWPLQFYTNFDS